MARKKTVDLTIEAVNHYVNRLTELAMSCFEWKGLPDSCDATFLEKTLFEKGKVLFFEDEVLGYLTLPCDTVGSLNVYGIETTRHVHAINGYTNTKTDKDSVLIYNNYAKSGSMCDVIYYARKLADIDRTIDINVNRQKTPLIILCDEKQKITVRKLYEDYEGHEPVIFGEKALGNEIKILNTEAKYVAQQLYDLKQSFWQEALTCLGIPNSSIEKRERVNTAEIEANNAGTVAMRYRRLEMRKQACDKINKMFGLNVSVEFRDNMTAGNDAINDEHAEGEVKENGNIHEDN
ncbi:MAG TPA: hypothetical protein VIL29_04790 [Pseudothermotoga sp.]